MNKRIQKKKAKLAALHTSRWKYVKIAEKRRHKVGIHTEQCLNHLPPRTDAWSRKLRMKRRLGKAYPEYAHKRLQQLLKERLNYGTNTNRK